jgi:hypothetical protein
MERSPPPGRRGSEADSGTTTVAVTVHNTSNQPIYAVRVHWMDLNSATQAGEVDRLGTIGPLSEMRTSRVGPDNVLPRRFAPVVFFRDTAAQRWTVTRAGHLASVDPKLEDGAPLIGINAVTVLDC